MTSAPKKTWRDYLSIAKEVILVGLLVGPFFMAFTVLTIKGAWAIYGPDIVVAVQGEFGIAENRRLVMQALGEDRVIRQPSGLSYIEEPVFSGGQAVIVLVIRRTALGVACLFTGGRPLFTGRDGIPRAGDTLGPVQQVGIDTARFEIRMTVPAELPPGRATVYLALDYTCNGKFVGDRTYDMPFDLLPPQSVRPTLEDIRK